jgi:RNA polymerase sigma-70 factor (ECF subfamily)
MEPGDASLDDVAEPDRIDMLEEREYQQHLVSRALELMRAEFHATTWNACWEYVVCGRPVVEVSRELGITVNAVYLAKARVLGRLRQELKDLLES